MKSLIAVTLFVLASLFGATARAETPADETPAAETDGAEKPGKAKAKAKPAADLGFGMCMGLATRCGLLPKGICFMQAGCMNPLYGDRCNGTAKQCTGFNSKNLCMMQRGCTWVKQTKK